jgi:predicted Zn-dependent peptidase
LGYYVHTSVDATTDTGYLVTQSGIKNGNLQKAIELILHEYRDFRDNKITPRELKKAKDYIRGSMALSLDSTDSQASFYATQELMENNILSPEDKLKMIDKVSVGDIKKVAEDIFAPEKFNLSVIGPIEEAEKKALEMLLTL